MSQSAHKGLLITDRISSRVDTEQQ